MYEKLNDDKYVTLTKREYDKLEERAKGVIGSYENRIKRLEEMVEHMKASKPYISHSTDFNYFNGMEEPELVVEGNLTWLKRDGVDVAIISDWDSVSFSQQGSPFTFAEIKAIYFAMKKMYDLED